MTEPGIDRAAFANSRQGGELSFPNPLSGNNTEDFSAAPPVDRNLLRAACTIDVDGILRRLTSVVRIVGEAVCSADPENRWGAPEVDVRRTVDIGLGNELDPRLAAALKVRSADSVLMTPIIAKDTGLPVTFDSDDWEFFVYAPQGGILALEVVFDHDPTDPYVSRWDIATPPSQARFVRCSVVVRAGSGGTPNVSLKLVDGPSVVEIPRVERGQSATACALVSTHETPSDGGTYRYRFTPAQVVEAQTHLRTGR